MNEYQYRSLSITLLGLEQSLREAETWLQGRQVKGILYHRKLKLSPEKRAQAQQQIAAALDHIAELSRLFELSVEEDDPGGLIRGEMTVHWANLLDSQSRKLKRFGKVHPKAAELLDAQLLDLSKIAINLANLFNDDAPASGEKS